MLLSLFINRIALLAKISMKRILLIATLSLISCLTLAEENYRITLLRASPGALSDLILTVKKYSVKQDGNLSIMRHSQGDHWDLMLLEPSGASPTKSADFGALADFQHSFLAKSTTDWRTIQSIAADSDLYHIEMFHAVHGKAKELLKQRKMENAYLTATKRNANIIFETTFGSDVDSFTIGYYKNLLQFASMPDLPENVFAKAATDAGFESRDTIGLYLRKLIMSHNDTLATRVD